jgi:hypothetical protein
MERALLGFDMLVTSGARSDRDPSGGSRPSCVSRNLLGCGDEARPHSACDAITSFNLPGNPVSALVCFEVLVRPANALQGLPIRFRRSARAPGESVRQNTGRDDFRGVVSGAPGTRFGSCPSTARSRT